MLLWLLFALLTVGVLAAVLRPLGRAPAPAEAGDAAGFSVYRHQLDELEAERARGLLDEHEAAAAKIEIARRLLAIPPADSPNAPPRAPALGPDRGSVALAVAIAVPLLALGLYLTYGSPELPSFPASARATLPPGQAHLAELIAKVEARLREHPEDGEGWDVIAPVYMRLQRYGDAADAFARAARLKGETPKRLSGFAEATVLAADGVVSEEARAAFEKLRKIEPARHEPRFWLALAKEQDGKLAEALADYKSLLAEAPPDAPWRAEVEARAADAGWRLAGGAAPAATASASPGPSSADVAAAAKMSAGERAEMIAGMVDGLARRLKENGNDLPGWQRLVRAYVVLGRKEQALEALGAARRAFGGNERALGELSALATSLGLGS